MASLNENEFVMAINTAFRSELDDIHSMLQPDWIPISQITRNEPNQPSFISSIEDTSRVVVPLSMHHTPFYIARNTVLIGDAARRVHPLAGQGFNMGIGDVIQLRRIILNDLEFGSSIGMFTLPRTLGFSHG